MFPHFFPSGGNIWGFVSFPVVRFGKPKFHIKHLFAVMLVVWAVQLKEMHTHSQNIVSPFFPLKGVVEEIEVHKVDPYPLK